MVSVLAVMLIGFTIIAVPTGIVASEMTRSRDVHTNTQACPMCAADGHNDDARHCWKCGARL